MSHLHCKSLMITQLLEWSQHSQTPIFSIRVQINIKENDATFCVKSYRLTMKNKMQYKVERNK